MTAAGPPLTRAEAARLLGVDPEAGPADVQRAFLRAARHVHPDVLPDADEAGRRVAATAFDELLRARAVLLVPPAGPGAAPWAPGERPRGDGRGLGGSLVILALLAFLLVALVTVEQGLRGDPVGAGGGAPASSAPPG